MLAHTLEGQTSDGRSKVPEPMRNRDATKDDPNPARGTVDAVRGAVVDVVFNAVDLPQINSALIVEWDRPTPLVLEVHSHLDLQTLRAVAFQSTAGLARGVTVRATGRPVSVPVRTEVLGRLLDVVGNPQDRPLEERSSTIRSRHLSLLH